MNEQTYKPEPLKLNPIWFMRTTPATYLRKIVKLRKQHTANVANKKWQANDTVNRKIRETWDAFHKLSNRFRAAGDVCFLCGGKVSTPTITGIIPEREIFCCAEHCEQFGILKGAI